MLVLKRYFPRPLSLSRQILIPSTGHGKNAALGETERAEFHRVLDKLAQDEPDHARALIARYCTKGGTPSAQTLSAHAKFDREMGHGKTLFFSYLSPVDKSRILELSKAEGAEKVIGQAKGKTAFFAALHPDVKYSALRAWQKERGETHSSELLQTGTPAMAELWKYSVTQAVPMIGFGFVDNFFMISFGGVIDNFFGLYVSTMAAAGLGNLCSNILGLGIADHIETLSTRMGLPKANLSEVQKTMTTVRFAGLGGIVAGVSIGCILGLIPCLFIHNDKNRKCQGDEDVEVII